MQNSRWKMKWFSAMVFASLLFATLAIFAEPVWAQEASASPESDLPFCDEITIPDEGWSGSPSASPGGDSTSTASASATATASPEPNIPSSPEPEGSASANCVERPVEPTTPEPSDPNATASAPLVVGGEAVEEKPEELPQTGGPAWLSVLPALVLVVGGVIGISLLKSSRQHR